MLFPQVVGTAPTRVLKHYQPEIPFEIWILHEYRELLEEGENE